MGYRINANYMINLFKKVKTAIKLIRRRFLHVPNEEKVLFDVRTIYSGTFNVLYRGISAIRCPFDYVLYQMIINEVKPDLVIEIGTNIGGTTLYVADIMNSLNHGIIHSIDIKKKTGDLVTEHPRIKLFTNGWENYGINEAKNFKKILVIEDASHMYEDSLKALYKFSPLVNIGSYYIIEDGIINKLRREDGFHGGPLRAIREFLKSNKNFIVDRKYCDMFGKNATFNVNGYLKRIK